MEVGTRKSERGIWVRGQRNTSPCYRPNSAFRVPRSEPLVALVPARYTVGHWKGIGESSRKCGPGRCIGAVEVFYVFQSGKLRRAVLRDLLIVDDELPILDLLGETVADEGFQVTLVADLPSALAALQSARFDLVLADALAEFTTGFAIDQWSALEAIRDQAGAAGVIIFSAHPARQFADYRERGFLDFIAKPFDLDALLTTLRGHLTTARREREATAPHFISI